jgi:hypothetical protein
MSSHHVPMGFPNPFAKMFPIAPWFYPIWLCPKFTSFVYKLKSKVQGNKLATVHPVSREASFVRLQRKLHSSSFRGSFIRSASGEASFVRLQGKLHSSFTICNISRFACNACFRPPLTIRSQDLPVMLVLDLPLLLDLRICM